MSETPQALANRLRTDKALVDELRDCGVYVFVRDDSGERQQPWQSDGELYRSFVIVSHKALEHREFRNDLLYELAGDFSADECGMEVTDDAC